MSDLGLRRPDARRRVPAAHGRAAERGRRRPGWVRERGQPAGGDEPGDRGRRRHAEIPAGASSLAAGAAFSRRRRARGHRAQPAPLHSPAPVADLLDDPADHVRAAVRLRVRRRGGGLASGRGVVRRLPAARHLRAVGGLPRDADRRRPVRGPRARRHRPLPLDADGTLGGADRPHRGRPRPQRPDHRC